MKTTNLFTRLIPLILFSCSHAFGQVSITDENPGYSQDFDTLPIPITNGQPFDWTNNETLTGWYRTLVTTVDVIDNSRTWSGNGAANVSSVPAFFNYGSGVFDSHASGPSDRAIGMRIITGQKGMMGLVMRNDSSQPLVEMHVDYRGEQWRRQTVDGSTRTLQFQYAVLAELTPAEFELYETEGFVGVESLNFISPNNTGVGPSGLDGNYEGFVDDDASAPANFVELSDSVVLNEPVDPGFFIVLRWYYESPEGSGAAMAIDDLDIVFEHGESSAGFELTLNYNAAGGTVLVDPALEVYVDGAEINFSAVPAPWFSFGGWSGDVSDVQPSFEAQDIIAYMSSDRSLTANFVAQASLWDGTETYADWRYDLRGWLYDLEFPYIFNFDHGWLYLAPGSDVENLYFYSYNLGGWVWIDSSWLEYYDFSAEAWVTVE